MAKKQPRTSCSTEAAAKEFSCQTVKRLNTLSHAPLAVEETQYDESTGTGPESKVEQVPNRAVGANGILQDSQEFEGDNATDSASVNAQYSHARRGRLQSSRKPPRRAERATPEFVRILQPYYWSTEYPDTAITHAMTTAQDIFWFSPQAGKACLIVLQLRPWDVSTAELPAMDGVRRFPRSLHHRELICYAVPDSLILELH